MKHPQDATKREWIEQAHKLTNLLKAEQVIDEVTYYYLPVESHLEQKPFGMKVTIEHKTADSQGRWDELFNEIVDRMHFEWGHLHDN